MTSIHDRIRDLLDLTNYVLLQVKSLQGELEDLEHEARKQVQEPEPEWVLLNDEEYPPLHVFWDSSTDYGVDEYARSSDPNSAWTVTGYLVTLRPDLWKHTDPEASATLRDGWWLTHRAPSGWPIKVNASPSLREQDISQVNAYPRWLLDQRFGSQVHD